MNYYVARNGQTFGPYSEELARKYLAEGSITAADLACTDANPSWVPLGQLLGPSAPSGSVPMPPPPPVFARSPLGGNTPPDLHWALVLLITFITSGLFYTIWSFIQANWIKTIDPASKAIRDLVIAILLPIVGAIGAMIAIGMAAVTSGGFDHLSWAEMGGIATAGVALCAFVLIGFVFHLKAFFGMRDSLERHYNSTEPIQLRLSGVMTFFFNVLYFQYHMSRISDWKRTGILRP